MAPPVSSLRDRRRRRTAQDIQQATLHLAERHGFDAVTTEMIAAEAGISVRTFFNYYTNKETAAVGEIPRFRSEAIEEFVSGRNPLLSDLEALLRDHLRNIDEERTVVRAVIQLANVTPRLTMLHIDAMRDLHRLLTQSLIRRLPGEDPQTLDMLSELAIGCARRAINLWVESDDTGIDQALRTTLSRLPTVATLLTVDHPA